jgi:hypothetical protein
MIWCPAEGMLLRRFSQTRIGGEKYFRDKNGGMQADGKAQCQKEVSTRKHGGASLGPAGVGLVR